MEAKSTNKRVSNFLSPTTDGKPPSIQLENSAPTTGPLKKRIKKRCSLDSTCFLPMTPAGFYNFTPDFPSRGNDDKSPISGRATPIPKFRMPLADVSINGVSNFQYGTTKSTKKLSPRLVSIPENETKENLHSANSALARRSPKQRGQLSTRAEPRSTLLPHSPITTKTKANLCRSSGPRSLSLAGECTNNYMRLIRQQYEFFELSSQDVAVCTARNVPAQVGQVGLRCRHCTCIGIGFRPTGSLAIANMHQSLYKYFASGKSNHVEELCPFVPKNIKKQLVALRYQLRYSQGRPSFWQDFGYWCDKAKAVGVVETPFGLRFKSSLMLKEAELLWEETFLPTKPKSAMKNPDSKRKTELPEEMLPKRAMDSYSEQGKGTVSLRQKKAERSWNDRLQEFIDYKERSGHGLVPQNFPENRKLGVWVNKQRMAKRARDDGKASTMTNERIEILEKAGFTWAKAKGKKGWQEKFLELQKYFEEHGHCDVPTKCKNNSSLGRWVSNMRKEYKEYVSNGSSSVEEREMERRIRLLEAMNFSWNLGSVRNLSEDDDDKETKRF